MILVGYDGSRRSQDALVLAGLLARIGPGRVTAVYVYGYRRSARISIRPGEFAATFVDAERTLGLLRDRLGDKIDVRAAGGLSAARGLQELAEDGGADLIVVGSTARGRRGSTLPGTTADRLLNGAPVRGPLTNPRAAHRRRPGARGAHRRARRRCSAPAHRRPRPIGHGLRAHGPILRAVLASVSHGVLLDSLCPVLLLPRGAPPLTEGRLCDGPVAVGARAREEGVTTFTALMLATNTEMMDVLMALGPLRVIDRELGTVEIEMPIPKVGLSPALRKLLRVAARNNVAVPPSGRPSAGRFNGVN